MKPLLEAFTRVQFQQTGFLSTCAVDLEGHPFGSIVQYDISEDKSFVFSVSTISEHYNNIRSDNRVSILVTDPFGGHNPQRYSRTSILGRAELLGDVAAIPYRDSYLKRFPESSARELAHDFVYVRLVPDTIRWILGFGSMGWATEEWSSFELDPIAAQGLPIAAHMNFDHIDSLPVLARVAGENVRSDEQVRLVFVCATFFELQICSERESRRVRLDFSKYCETAAAVRKEIIALLGTAQH